jgi:chemotaxis protein histidine kinase CheA
MIFRKAGLGSVIISLALLLSSCVEVRGELSVSSAARINGEIIYTLSKSSAAGVGLSSLADVKSEASTNPEAQIGLCKDAPITEDASNYILKCALRDILTDSGEVSASITGSNIVFRYKANLDPSSTQGDQTNFGSVSITIRFLNPVISFKENKVGLVTKVDDLTYRISGSANEPMNIEITANLAASSGSASTAPAPVPSTTANPTNEASAVTDAANKAAADKAAADLKAKQEAEEKAAADLKAKEEAEAKAAADKAAEDLKAKQEAEAKAAADLKAKQEAEAKVAADLKAKQEAEAVEEKAAADLKAKQEADAKAAADLKAKQEADAKAAADKAAADLKTKQEADAKVAADKAAADLKAKKAAEAKAAAAKILAAAKAKAAATKKTTITCVKGKLTKKVTAVKPICPKGYKKK